MITWKDWRLGAWEREGEAPPTWARYWTRGEDEHEERRLAVRVQLNPPWALADSEEPKYKAGDVFVFVGEGEGEEAPEEVAPEEVVPSLAYMDHELVDNSFGNVWDERGMRLQADFDLAQEILEAKLNENAEVETYGLRQVTWKHLGNGHLYQFTGFACIVARGGSADGEIGVTYMDGHGHLFVRPLDRFLDRFIPQPKK